MQEASTLKSSHGCVPGATCRRRRGSAAERPATAAAQKPGPPLGTLLRGSSHSYRFQRRFCAPAHSGQSNRAADQSGHLGTLGYPPEAKSCVNRKNVSSLAHHQKSITGGCVPQKQKPIQHPGKSLNVRWSETQPPKSYLKVPSKWFRKYCTKMFSLFMSVLLNFTNLQLPKRLCPLKFVGIWFRTVEKTFWTIRYNLKCVKLPRWGWGNCTEKN
nr:uncharacterized protein LOC116823701 [Chelonoidis abingdonii]